MNLRSRLNHPATRTRAGLIALIVASVTNFALHRGARGSAEWVDALVGVLYGIAIALLLLSLRSGWGKHRAPHGRG